MVAITCIASLTNNSFENIGKMLDKYSKHDKFMLVGDFNAEKSEPCLAQFLYEYDAKNTV